jgi:2-dehydro-3-deoxy-D-arabinonate dehydratase
MALCRYMTYLPQVGRQKRWGWVEENRVTPLDEQAVMRVLTEPDAAGLNRLAEAAVSTSDSETLAFDALQTEPNRYGRPSLVAPVLSGQEVWGAGVTYESSKIARMAESPEGGDFYARVYLAERPELFFKATPNRVVGALDRVRIRQDATWNVPEPELAVLIAANGQILGYTVGNDMSSRDIEGENPLYLPQAKLYQGSCALGPVIVPADRLDPQNVRIELTIRRGETVAFSGETSTQRMRRPVADLVPWLFRDNVFAQGVLLLTGTGLIPPDDFTLEPGDRVAIHMSGIGTLENTVERLGAEETRS